MNWYSIYTKPKREGYVLESLKAAGLTVYSPLLKQKRFIGGKYRETISSLFPCYIFARFEPEKHLWMIRYTRGIKKVVGDTEKPWPVSENIIDFIKSQEHEGIVAVKPVNFERGDRVRITEGPLKDFTGIFEREVDGRERVVLLLSAIEYQSSVIVDRASLARA